MRDDRAPIDEAAPGSEPRVPAAASPAGPPDPGAVPPAGFGAPEPSPVSGPVSAGEIKEQVIQVLRETFDPEIPVNIYELGLVYGIDVTNEGAVHVLMTLTSPMCPVAGSLPPEVEGKIRDLAGVTGAQVQLVWDPPWSMNMMTEAAKLQLGLL